MSIGKKIKSLRTEKNMSIKELCEKTKISIATLSKYEEEILKVPKINIRKLANAFKVKEEELGIEEKTKNPDKKKVSAAASKNMYKPVTKKIKKHVPSEKGIKIDTKVLRKLTVFEKYNKLNSKDKMLVKNFIEELFDKK